ncbi:MAG: DUF1127 domain-containing protein [Pseudomonadota bacterium]
MSSRSFGYAARPFPRHPFGWLYEAIETVRKWRRRVRLRRHLSHFGDHLLDDIGLDRQSAEAEISKPFWRP